MRFVKLSLISFCIWSCNPKPKNEVGTCFHWLDLKMNYKIVGINEDTYTFKSCSSELKVNCFESQGFQNGRFDLFDENKSLMKVDCKEIK